MEKSTHFIFEISVQPDLAPSVQWIEPEENTLLVAPNDLLSFSALAKDDLGLARVEYMLKKNQDAWKSFPIPKFLNPRGQKNVGLSFQLDLLGHKLKPGTQALLKLRAQDLKGTHAETEIIQLSIVSRDFDLSSIKLLEAKAEIIAKLDTLYDQCSQSQKIIQETQRDFHQQKVSKNTWLEKISLVEAGFLAVADPAYHDSLQTLLKMPRGADSHEVSIYAQAKGQFFTSLATHWKNSVDQIDLESDPNRIRSSSHEFSKIISKRKRISGNLKNIGQDILNQHAEMMAISYLHSLHQRQQELLEDYRNKKAIPFLARRQEVALNHGTIAQTLSYSKIGSVPRSKDLIEQINCLSPWSMEFRTGKNSKNKSKPGKKVFIASYKKPSENLRPRPKNLSERNRKSSSGILNPIILTGMTSKENGTAWFEPGLQILPFYPVKSSRQ